MKGFVRILLISVCISISTLSCSSQPNEKNINSNTNQNSVDINSTAVTKNNAPVIKKKLVQPKKIDSTKLIKAFENIYFGIEEKTYLDDIEVPMDSLRLNTYSIHNLDFKLKLSEYDSSYGLYEFDLRSELLFDKIEQVTEWMKFINETILLAYQDYQVIDIVDNSPAAFNQIYHSPIDNRFVYYKYLYLKGDVSLKLGYDVVYPKGNAAPKKHRVVLQFQRLSIIHMKKDKEVKDLKERQIKEASKF